MSYRTLFVRTTASMGLAILLAATDSFAGDVEEASRLFREGRAAMKGEDYATAADKLAASQELDPSAGTQLNLAICEAELGQLGRAWKHLQAVLEGLAADDPRRPIAQQRAEAIESDVPWLGIRVETGEQEGTEVYLDGRRVPDAELGKPMPVDPGKHRVVVRSALGTRTRDVHLEQGVREDVVFDFTSSVEDGESGSESQPEAAGSTPTGAYLLLAAGAIGVGTGTYLWFELNEKQDVVDNNCDANKQCNEGGLQAAEDGKSLTPVYAGAWAVGAVGLAAGTYLLLDTGEPDEAHTRIGAAPMPGGAAVGVSGRF